jgi:hypothetical protein
MLDQFEAQMSQLLFDEHERQSGDQPEKPLDTSDQPDEPFDTFQVTVPPNRDLAKSEQRLKSMVANRVTR